MFSDFYHCVYYITLILSSVIALFLFSKVNHVFKCVCILILFTLINEITARIFRDVLMRNNGIVYNLFTPIEYFLYLCIYGLFFQNKKIHVLLSASLIFMIIAEIINALFLQPFRLPATNIMSLENVLLVFLSLAAFVHFRSFDIAGDIIKEPIFWFNSAVLIYYAYNILFWGFHNLGVYNLKEPPMILYNINLLMSAALYIAFIYAIWLDAKQHQNTLFEYE